MNLASLTLGTLLLYLFLFYDTNCESLQEPKIIVRYLVGCSQSAEKAKQFAKHPKKSHYFGSVQLYEWNAYTNFSYCLNHIDKQEKHPHCFQEADVSFILKPQHLRPGQYSCTFRYMHRKYRKQFEITGWFLDVETAPPTAHITGGQSITAPPDEDIVLSASGSIDLYTTKNLIYKWSCTAKIDSKKFCSNNPISNDKTVTIPAESVVLNEEFTVKLEVVSSDSLTDKTEQKIFIKSNSARLELTCIRNCRPDNLISNSIYETHLSVSCKTNCANIGRDNFIWSVSSKTDHTFKFDYNLNSFGRTGHKFAIKRNVFKKGSYVISVKVDGVAEINGESSMELSYDSFVPNIKACFTVPREGIAGQTPFTFFCDQSDEKDVYFYEVIRGDTFSGKVIISGRSPDVFEYEFFVSDTSTSKYLIRISSIKATLYFEMPLETTSRKVGHHRTHSQIISNIKELMNNPRAGGKSFLQLVESQVVEQRKTASELLYVYFCEVHDNVDSNSVWNLWNLLRVSVIDRLNKLPDSDARPFMEKFSELVAAIMKSDAAAEKKLNNQLEFNMCNLMVEVFERKVKHSDQLLKREATNLRVAQKLASCYDLDDKQPLLFPKVLTVENSRLQDVCIVKESTEYMNFLGTAQAFKSTELQELIYTTINVTMLITKIMSVTTMRDIKYANVTIDSADVIVMKDTGANLARKAIKYHGTTLYPSADLRNTSLSNHPLEIFMAIWTQDIMHLNNYAVDVSTDIVVPQIWHAKCEGIITKFDSPSRLLFSIKEERKPPSTTVETIKLPAEYPTRVNPNLFVRVHRVDLFKYGTLRVQFYNVSHNEVFEVITTTFVYPGVDDFTTKDIKRIDANNTFLIYKNNNSYMVWSYVAIMPDRYYYKDQEDLVLSFNISFQISSCIKFNENDNIWEQACKEESTLSHVDSMLCECNQFSIISGYVDNIKPVQQVIYEDYTVLELSACYIIFGTVTLTYILYAVFLIFAIWKKKEAFYFLADNMMNDLYAYLIIVRTSNAYNSGTTSAVAIKVYGDRSNSESHILNYPDPQLHLLQRFGEDTFVMTTSRHLGSITQIELWYSCTGSSPTWYCRDILIYDLQDRREWYFYINKRFFIITGMTHMICTPHEEGADIEESVWSRLRVCGEFHSWYLFSCQEKFAYMKRITVVLSTMLTNFTLCLIFYGAPRLVLQDIIDDTGRDSGYLRSLTRAVSIGFSSSSCSFTFHIIIAWIFRRSKIQFSRRKKQIAPLPFAVTIACWSLVTINIVVCTCYLSIMGFWVPRLKSLLWLASSLLGIASEIFIYDNFIVLIHSFFSKGRLVVDIGHKIDVIIQNIELQRNILYQKFGAALFRPHLTHLYEPLKKYQIEEKKIIVKHRQKIATDILDMFGFIIYFILLNLMISSTRNPNTLESKNTLIDMMEGKFTRTLSFNDVHSYEEIYDFIEQTLIPALHPIYWYHDKKILSEALMIDMTNKFLGVVRIRQHRLKPNACQVNEKLRFLFKNCNPEFKPQYEETRRFGYHWSKFSPHDFVAYDRYGYIWKYVDPNSRNTHPVLGTFTWYPGGGYEALLGRAKEQSLMKFRNLVRNGWLDQRTRSVIIDFLTYSANSNMFNAVSMIYEQSATGYTTARIRSQAARMLMNDNEQEYRTMIIFYIYHVWVAVLFFKHSIRIILHVKTFFKHIWFLLDVTITILNIATLILYYIRLNTIKALTDELTESHHTKFIYYFSIFQYDEYMNFVTAFVLTVATLRLWQFLRFNKIFRIMERTLAIACVPLLAATFGFFVILMAFGLTGMILLGREFRDFYTLMSISRTLVTMSLKPDQFDIREFLILKIVYPYFSIYLCLMQIVLFVYIIIIIMAYMKAQMEFSVGEEPYTIKHYLQEQAKLMPKLLKGHFSRIVGGQQSNKKVLPKADEFRYANCVQIQVSSIRKMKLITKNIIRKIREDGREVSELSDDDLNLMMQACYSFVLSKLEEDDKDMFFKGHFAGKKISLIDEKRIMMIESVVNQLFTKTAKRRALARRNSVHMQTCAYVIKRNHSLLKVIHIRLASILNKLEEYGI